MPHVEGYRHLRGVHCGTTALRSLTYHQTGQKWSEALCFGLASGLNFTYLREPGTSFILTMGRGSYMELHFCDALGAYLEHYHSEDAELSWHHLRQLLDRGELVLIDVDMFYLPYLIQALGLMEGVHFGGHKLLVEGYEGDQVFVYDYAWTQPLTLSVDQLMKARGSRECASLPHNGCFLFHFPEEMTPLSEAIPAALQTMVYQMKHPFMPFNGLKAVERFRRQAARWGRVFRGEELAVNTALTGFMIEKAGTGGGNFRNLYYRFLREAAEILEAPRLLEIAGVYRRLAIAWREVASLLEEAAEDLGRGMYDPRGSQQQLLDEIGELEHRGVAEIEDFLQARRLAAPVAAAGDSSRQREMSFA